VVEHESDATVAERRSASSSIDRKGLSQLPRPISEMVGTTTALHDGVDAIHNMSTADQDGLGFTDLTRHDVDAPVDAVGPIHIDRTGWSEHGLVASGPTSVRVACGVLRTAVRLDLIDDDLHTVAVRVGGDVSTEEPGRDIEGMTPNSSSHAGGVQSCPRSVAPVDSATASAIALRTGPISSSVSVRSGARNLKLMA
jgi:hypothetical protein